MCNGNKRCTACSSKIGKMARSKKLINPTTKKLATKAVGGGIGILASKYATNNIAFLQTNEMLSGIIKSGVGIFVAASSKNNFIQGLGGGVAADGVLQTSASLLKKYAPSTALQLGISGINRIGTVRKRYVSQLNGIKKSPVYMNEAAMVQ